jgi:hypothetical protein
MTVRTSVHEPQHWLQRAEKARVHAEQMTDPNLKRRMLEVADGYERIAAQLRRPRGEREPIRPAPRILNVSGVLSPPTFFLGDERV